MDLVEFTWSALSGVAGNFIYEQSKKTLGTRATRQLEKAQQDKDKESFKNTLEMLLESNQEMRSKLENLQSGKPTIYQKNVNGNNFNINGDNIAGDKFTGNKYGR